MAACNAMQPDCHLWLAFQPNTLKDFNSQLPNEWPQMISEMRSRLENHFYLPTLSNNLRNASEVFNMTEALKSKPIKTINLDVKDSLGITTVAMTIHSTTPKLIPILSEEQDKFLVDAILFAVERTREEIGNQTSSFVILHDEKFETNKIFNLIHSKKKREDEVFKYPPNQNTLSLSLDYLDGLMENKVHGLLVMRDKAFKGSESQNVVLLMSENAYNFSDMRCNMLRCISNLSIVQVMYESEVIKFDKVRLYENFISCLKNCEIYMYQCQTCIEEYQNDCGEQNKKNVFICRSCKMKNSCHPIDHQFKLLTVKRDLKRKRAKCGCHCNN